MKTLALAAAAALTFAVPASAAIYDFSVVSAIQTGDPAYIPNYQFSIDTSTLMYSNEVSSTFFDILTSGQRPSLGSPAGDVSYTTNYNFYTADAGGGFDDDSSGHSYFGDQLFAGTTADPAFLIGTHDLFYGDSTAPDAVLTISSVPEAATWIMMILGFGLIGGLIRRTSRKPTRLAA